MEPWSAQERAISSIKDKGAIITTSCNSDNIVKSVSIEVPNGDGVPSTEISKPESINLALVIKSMIVDQIQLFIRDTGAVVEWAKTGTFTAVSVALSGNLACASFLVKLVVFGPIAFEQITLALGLDARNLKYSTTKR